MKIRFLYIILLLMLGLQMHAQTSKPSVINMMKQSELSASPAIRQAAEFIPDYSTKKERPITVVEVPVPASAIKNGYAEPIGPKPVPSVDKPGIATQSLNNFLGVADEATFRLESGGTSRFIPPDVGGYVGPNHVVAISNNQIRITTKAGVQLAKVDIEVFWQGTPGYGTSGNPYGAGDPHILYDYMADRWITIVQTSLVAGSSLLVGVSQTNDPTGNWNRYSYRTDATDVTAFDYPQIGYTADWVVISGNMFPIAGGSATNQQLYIFKKADLYAAEPLTLDSNAQRIITTMSVDGGWSAPVTPMDNSLAANTMYLVQPFFTSAGNSVVKISTLTGVIPAVTWNTGAATFTQSPQGNYSFGGLGNAAPQKDESRGLQTNDGRFSQSIMRNNRIWAVHHVVPSGGASRTAIQWWQFNTNGTVVQNGRIDDTEGKTFRTFPSLSVNASEDMVIGYSIFSKDIFPSAAYAVRKGCTPVNTISSETIYKEGVSKYFKNFGGTRARWGDYSYSSLDPTTGTFWTVQQVADQRVGAADNDSRWASWWAEVQPGVSNAINFGFPMSAVNESEATTAGACLPFKDISIPLRAICKATGAGIVTVSATGTATAGDYELLTPSVNFAVDDFEKNVTVRVFKDQIQEATETIVLNFAVSGLGIVKGVETITHTIYIGNIAVQPPVPTGAISVAVGQSDNTSNNNQPFRGSFSDSRTQWLFTATELSAAGFSAGNISKMALNITSKASGTSPFVGLTIKVRNITSTSLATGTFASGLTTVYGPTDYVTEVGTNEFVFASPFFWDGTSSLLFDMCFDNESATGADVVASNATTPTIMQVWARDNGLVGCSITISSFGAFTINSASTNLRPVTTITLASTGTPIASTLNANSKAYLGPNADVYLYNSSNEIMARIQNLGTHDYGCTNITVDRAGTGAVLFSDNNPAKAVASKTIHISPVNPNASGQVRVTLYYTKTEVEGWQTATGNTWANVQMVKTVNAISSYTAGAIPTGDVLVASVTDKIPLGEQYSIAATFSNGFSGFGAGIVNNPLPVTWLNAQAVLQQGSAVITWATANEQNNARFEVETSRNGQQYISLAVIPGKGNSNLRSDYSFIHKRPQAGMNYYRIKQMDKDGTSSYSRTMVIKMGENGQARPVVYPVPAANNITLYMGQLTNAKMPWEILGADSRILLAGVFQASSLTERINIQKLPRGIYFLRLHTSAGKEMLRFVKQ